MGLFIVKIGNFDKVTWSMSAFAKTSAPVISAMFRSCDHIDPVSDLLQIQPKTDHCIPTAKSPAYFRYALC